MKKFFSTRPLLLGVMIAVVAFIIIDLFLRGGLPLSPEVGSTLVMEKDGMTLVYVPAGEFLMGSSASDPAANANEKPQHSVYLDAFWIDRTEVTNAMYRQCVQAGKCPEPLHASSYARQDYYGNSVFDNFPVVYVSWYNAQSYCAWAGRRLPSEAEWEKAARGTDAFVYPWGDTPPSATLANSGRVVIDTTAVGSYPAGASPYGALDMAGNVWEWVNDFYSETYYSVTPLRNPTGPATGTQHVTRGGGWDYAPSLVRTAVRIPLVPDYRYAYDGFRCAR